MSNTQIDLGVNDQGEFQFGINPKPGSNNPFGGIGLTDSNGNPINQVTTTTTTTTTTFTTTTTIRTTQSGELQYKTLLFL